MKILLTGATGFVGKRLGAELVRRGHEIIALVRDPEKAKLPFPAELCVWGEESPLPRVDAVVHLAGESIMGSWSPEGKERIIASRVGTAAELQRRLPSVPRVYVSSSGTGYYGDRGEEELDESSRVGHDFLAEVCAKWEGAALPMRERGARLVIFRIGIVLGVNGVFFDSILPVFRLGLGGKIGSGRQWLSWIHLDDLVGMIVHALENENVSGVFNAVSPRPVRNEEFTKTMGKVLRRPTFFIVPAFLLRLFLGEKSILPLGSQKVRSRISETGFQFQYRELEPALRSLLGSLQ